MIPSYLLFSKAHFHSAGERVKLYNDLKCFCNNGFHCIREPFTITNCAMTECIVGCSAVHSYVLACTLHTSSVTTDFSHLSGLPDDVSGWTEIIDEHEITYINNAKKQFCVSPCVALHPSDSLSVLSQCVSETPRMFSSSNSN